MAKSGKPRKPRSGNGPTSPGHAKVATKMSQRFDDDREDDEEDRASDLQASNKQSTNNLQDIHNNASTTSPELKTNQTFGDDSDDDEDDLASVAGANNKEAENDIQNKDILTDSNDGAKDNSVQIEQETPAKENTLQNNSTLKLWDVKGKSPTTFEAGHYPELKAVSLPAASFNTNCLPITTNQLIENEEDELELTMQNLDDPKVRQAMTAKKILVVLLLSITRAKSEGKADIIVYQKRGKRVKTQATYSRKMTFASLLDQTPITVSILEKNNDEHNQLFHWNLSLTNIKPGASFVIQNPRVIGQLASKSIIVETSLPLVQLRDPNLKIVPIIGDNTQHEMRYFIHKNKAIFCDPNHLPVPWRASCNGDSCDRLEYSSKCLMQCGCWNQNSKNDSTASNMVVKFDFGWTDPHLHVPTIRIKNFTSLRTSKILFRNERVVSDYDTLAYDINVQCIQSKFLSLVNHINNNGGWTIVGWCIRGEKENDDNRDENEAKLLSEHIKYHVCYLCPTTVKPATIDPSHLFGRDDIAVPAIPDDEE